MKAIVAATLLALSSSALAYGSFQSSWLEGANKICKYSDGSILTIGMSEMCPVSN